jgi:hypothetical protein
MKQKNSVQAIEYVVACPPDAIERLDGPPGAQNGKYLKDALSWLSERHGGAHRVVHAAVHRDEQSPHIHVIAVPVAQLTRRGGHTHATLSATQYVGGKKRLAALQTEFAEGVGKPWGLERGISKEITKRLHRPVRDWDAARVAAIESKDLDGLSREDLVAIVLRQRSIGAPGIAGGQEQAPTPTPTTSPTPSKPERPDWKRGYESAFEAAQAGDPRAAVAFLQAIEQERERVAALLAEKWKAEGKVDAKGMVGNRTLGQVADRQAGEFLADQIAGRKGEHERYSLADMLAPLDSLIAASARRVERAPKGPAQERPDRGRGQGYGGR